MKPTFSKRHTCQRKQQAKSSDNSQILQNVFSDPIVQPVGKEDTMDNVYMNPAVVADIVEPDRLLNIDNFGVYVHQRKSMEKPFKNEYEVSYQHLRSDIALK